MRRVVIMGPGAAGKSTLAVQLGRLTGLEVVELDRLFWQPGPSPTSTEEWTALQEKLAASPGWIMDGDLGPYAWSVPDSGWPTRSSFWTRLAGAAFGERPADPANAATSGSGYGPGVGDIGRG